MSASVDRQTVESGFKADVWKHSGNAKDSICLIKTERSVNQLNKKALAVKLN